MSKSCGFCSYSSDGSQGRNNIKCIFKVQEPPRKDVSQEEPKEKKLIIIIIISIVIVIVIIIILIIFWLLAGVNQVQFVVKVSGDRQRRPTIMDPNSEVSTIKIFSQNSTIKIFSQNSTLKIFWNSTIKFLFTIKGHNLQLKSSTMKALS